MTRSRFLALRRRGETVGMNARTVNVAIMLLLAFALVSGVFSFLVGEPKGRWIFWSHRASGLALVLLLTWKVGIAQRSYQRRGLSVGTGLSAVFGVLFMGSLVTGVLWAAAGLPRVPVPVLASWTALSLHVAISLLLIPFFLMHAFLRWPRPCRVDLIGRRAVIRMLGLLAAGLVFWRLQEILSAFLTPSGSRQRFTGSREEANFAGNLHPVTNWLSDPIPQIDFNHWRLRIYGAVDYETTLSYAEVLALGGAVRQATLDCTGGWYTVQRWSGVSAADLLKRTGTKDDARSLLVRASTGYARRFALDEVSDLLLATHVGDEVLSTGHGFPLRLVAPGHRGYNWVKWVVELEVSSDPAWLEAPLPLK